MSRFTGSLKLEEIKPGRLWRLLDPIRFEVGEAGSSLMVEAPAGMLTDGATLPPALRVFLAVWGTYGRAAAIHDYLYARLRAGSPHWLAPTRREADAIFFDAMIACGTSRGLAGLIWAMVRIFGGAAARR